MELNKGSRGFRLLTPGNPKTEKGRAQGYWTFILHFAPADLSGFNVCALSTAGCRKACLNTAGRGGIKAGTGILTYSHGQARQSQSRSSAHGGFGLGHSFSTGSSLWPVLIQEIAKAYRSLLAATVTLLCFRLNGTSDIRWESVPVADLPISSKCFRTFNSTTTRNCPTARTFPANYHLTFSLADGNDTFARVALANGMNVAAVFRSKETVARYMESGIDIGGTCVPVSRGDDTDLRFLDMPRHCIGLYAKGNAKRDSTGFVRD